MIFFFRSTCNLRSQNGNENIKTEEDTDIDVGSIDWPLQDEDSSGCSNSEIRVRSKADKLLWC